MVQINSFSLTKLNNAEFVAFFINLANLIERAEASKLGLDQSVMTKFAQTKEALVDQVRMTMASDLTQDMHDATDKRTRMFKLCNYSLQKVLITDGPAKALSHRVETLILKPYSLAILQLPQQELTTVLSGFIFDMRNKFTEDDLDDLGVSSELTNLESANQEFIAAYANRSEQRAETTSALTVKLRSDMHELYLSIIFQVQFYANSLATENADKATACTAFIAIVNEVLADVKRRYNQRTSKGSTTDVEQTEKPTDEKPADNNGGTNTPSGNGGAIDHENGTEHDGTIEF